MGKTNPMDYTRSGLREKREVLIRKKRNHVLFFLYWDWGKKRARLTLGGILRKPGLMLAAALGGGGLSSAGKESFSCTGTGGKEENPAESNAPKPRTLIFSR